MYARPGLPVKSSQTRLWTGCSNVEPTVDAAGDRHHGREHLEPAHVVPLALGVVDALDREAEEAVGRAAELASMANDTVLTPVTA